MSEPTPKEVSNVRQRLHDGRRNEVRDRFIKRLDTDTALRMHHAPSDQVDAWNAIGSRIFDAVFDRYDFLQSGSNEDYLARSHEIFKDMRHVGVAQDLAQQEFSRIATHAMLEVGVVHADDKQRAILTKVDGQGHRHGPDGRFSRHMRPGDATDVVKRLVEDAQVHASGVKVLLTKYDRLFQLIDAKLQEGFWGRNDSIKEVLNFARKDYGYPRHVSMDAIRLKLSEEFPDFPMPNILKKADHIDPSTVIQALRYGDAYEPAIKVVLFDYLDRSTKGAMAKLLTEYPDPAVLGDNQVREKFFDALATRIKPAYKLADFIANARLSVDAFQEFHDERRALLGSQQAGLRDYIAEAAARNHGSGKER